MKILEPYENYTFYKADLCDREKMEQVVKDHKPSIFVNLAAQAGVRHSLTDPFTYQKSNLEGFLNVLEVCRHNDVENLIYASSSSVFGGNKKVPFSVEDSVDQPVSFYAATKKSNELMAHSYSHLYGLNTTGLRFFTVYGPYGRPDMAMFLFTEAVLNNKPIEVFNHGDMTRDFTYIDDIVEGTTACIDNPHRYEVFNLGNNNPVELEYMISVIEKELGMTAEKKYLPLQLGDVPKTYADIEHTKEVLGWEPKITIEEGIHRFIEWYRDYNRK